MANILNKKHVVLGVTGGIACYKSPDLVRRLRDRGAVVHVVMTSGAQQFVTPLTFQAVSGNAVRGELFDREAEAAMGHIELARWADVIVVAPASANFIARLAQGRADDLLTTLCLATEQPVCIAPSMNRVMWDDAATQSNTLLLAERGITLMGPAAGDQACGETGSGRMLEPLEIVSHVADVLEQQRVSGPLTGKRVMITAGPTRERLDPVRYLTNRSSGKMGFAVATAAAQLGAEVTLISGPVSLETPEHIDRIDVESAQQMFDAVHEQINDVDIFIAAAAVADFRPTNVSHQKIKKSGNTETLELEPCPDIVFSVGHLDSPPFTVGFAAETQDVEQYARGKLENKKLNLIAANQVGDKNDGGAMLGFDSDDNELVVLSNDQRFSLAKTSKRLIAKQLMEIIVAEYQ